MVADMSSNFLSRRVDVSKYGVIFGGAVLNPETFSEASKLRCVSGLATFQEPY